MSEHVLSILVKALGANAASKEIKALETGIGGVGRIAGKGEAALAHFGGRLQGIATAVGAVGLAGGFLSVAGAMEEGIKKAADWGLSIEKLQGLTSDTAEQLSGLLGITEKYGISNERLAQIVGFTEKTLGKLAATSGGAAKGQKSLQAATDAVTKAQEKLQLAHVKLNEVEAKSGASASALLAARQRVTDATRNLTEAEQKLASVRAGGGLAGASKLVALQQQYGVVLTDSKGKALDFQSVLLNVADAYSKATTAADKAKDAALAASVFGRGYADLLPILKLGRKGILDAEQAAKDLGLTLSQTNVEDLAKFREASREAGDAVSGLELQLGLLVMPDLTDSLKSFTTFMSTHRAEVQQFFKDGLKVAEGLAAFVTGTLIPDLQAVGSALIAGWNMIPAPLRDMITQGVIADRTVKFLFGFSPIHTIVDLGQTALEKALGGIIGKGIVQPVFVTNQVPGGLPAAAAEGEAAGAGGLLGKALKFGAALGIAAAAVDLFVNNLAPLNQQIADMTTGIDQNVTSSIKTASDSQLQEQQAALIKALNDLDATTAGLGPLKDILYGSQFTSLHNDLQAVTDALQARTGVGANQREDRSTIEVTDQARKVGAAAGSLASSFLSLGEAAGVSIASIRKFDPAKALEYTLKGIAKRGEAKTGHAASQSAIDATFERDLLRYTRTIIGSGQTTAQKIAGVEKWEKIAVANKDWGVANKLKAEIQSLKARQSHDIAAAGQVAKSGGLAAAAAIRAKDLSLALTTVVNTVLNASISNRDFSKVHQQTKQAYVTSFGQGA
jgi:hypothetical protein